MNTLSAFQFLSVSARPEIPQVGPTGG